MIPGLDAPWALRLAWTLVHFLWQGALLGVAAWCVLAVLRNRNSRVRYGVACAFLALCALAPPITFFLLAPPAVGSFTSHTPLVLGFDPVPTRALFGTSSAGPLPWQTRLAPWLPTILLSWMIGSSLLALRAVGGWLWLQYLRRSATPVPEGQWVERVREMAAQAGISRTVQLLQSARVRTPMALGLVRPMILVPLGFFVQADAVGAEAVLAHELAHLRRLDPLVNGLQCILETLLFFHPAVHFISRRVRTERECCCDDEAVMACGDAVLYVETLCRLDALHGRPLSLVLSARGGNLMERITRLLAPTSAPRLAVPSLVLALVALGATALLAQAPKKPTLPPAAPSSVASHAPAPTAPPALPATDPWGEKGERASVQIEAKTLKEAIRKFAEARHLDPVIGNNIPDRDGPFVFRHSPWRAALENLVKSQGLVCVIQDGVLRVAYPNDLVNEGAWARQLAPKAEIARTAAAPAVIPQAVPEAKEGHAGTPATTTYLPPRRVKFHFRSAKEGAGKLSLEYRRVSREELLEALRKIDHLVKAGIDPERPLQGEWILPVLKDEGPDLLTFELNGVTTQSVRELYK